MSPDTFADTAWGGMVGLIFGWVAGMWVQELYWRALLIRNGMAEYDRKTGVWRVLKKTEEP